MSQQSQASIDRVLREYPQLQREIKRVYDIYRRNYPDAEVHVRLKVRRADPSLMYYSYFLAYRNRNSQSYTVWGELYSRPVESVSFHDSEGNVLQPAFKQGQLSKPTPLWDLIFGTDALYRKLSYVVTTTNTWWYPAPPTTSGFQGSPVRIDLDYTIHKAPKFTQLSSQFENPWVELNRRTDICKNVKLSGPMMLPHPDIDADWFKKAATTLGCLGEAFEHMVWNQGFGDIVTASNRRGMEGTFGDIKVASFISAGRMQIQLERGKAMFNIAALDAPEPRMGFGNIEGTVDEARALVYDAIRFWVTADEDTRNACYADSRSVSVG